MRKSYNIYFRSFKYFIKELNLKPLNLFSNSLNLIENVKNHLKNR